MITSSVRLFLHKGLTAQQSSTITNPVGIKTRAALFYFNTYLNGNVFFGCMMLLCVQPVPFICDKMQLMLDQWFSVKEKWNKMVPAEFVLQ